MVKKKADRPETRVENDSMGALDVPSEALWGAQTQRAVNNFAISGLAMPRSFIQALGLIKASAAEANAELGLLDKGRATAIVKAAEAVAAGEHDKHFPVDVFQTGSGTSSNMNANEVIAHLASGFAKKTVHPNDHVNMGQSSNDVIPSAIHISAAIGVERNLKPTLKKLALSLERKAKKLATVTKTGRTHLMDAMPVTFGQEVGAWAAQIRLSIERLDACMPRLYSLAQGGTAVGTGINADPRFAKVFVRCLKKRTKVGFKTSDNYFVSIATQDTAVELSGQLKTLAVSLTKISNDLRWMNAGPLAGMAEISLPALQPGSSIMPGKVNPVIPEATAMVCAQVIGNDATITVAGQSGNFQLNVMLPVIAYNLLQSIELLSNSSILLAEKAIKGFTVNHENLQQALDKNPILVTALNAVIGYDQGAVIAKQAYTEGRAILDVAEEQTNLSAAELKHLLNPYALTKGGIGR